jgi:N-ethylmaleimide reductase
MQLCISPPARTAVSPAPSTRKEYEMPRSNVSATTLFSPGQAGAAILNNRIVMAPMTRSRAGQARTPNALMATYYEQRASAGLIVTEGTQISPQGIGYPGTPGIHTDAQVAAWREVTDAVHARGGRIFVQLWHVGRISHPELQPGGALPVAPSAIAPAGLALTETGQHPFVTPRALDTREIAEVVQQYADAARRAREAGFDGVELHGANGYLIDQFLRDGTNHRTDAYGGSIEKRTRFLLEVVDAVSRAWSADRLGVRLSPTGTFNDMSDSDPLRHFSHVARALSGAGLAYLHLVLPRAFDASTFEHTVASELRRAFRGTVMLNGGFDRETGNAVLASGLADLVSFGALFLANPDLPERFAEEAPLNAPNRDGFYGGGASGYTDYPTRHEMAANLGTHTSAK